MQYAVRVCITGIESGNDDFCNRAFETLTKRHCSRQLLPACMPRPNEPKSDVQVLSLTIQKILARAASGPSEPE